MNICEFCGKQNARKRFCNRSCSNAWQHANGLRRTYVNDKSIWQWWIERYGEEEALQRKELQRQALSKSFSGTKNPMFGQTAHTHGIRAFDIFRKGKTLEETFGKEKALKRM